MHFRSFASVPAPVPAAITFAIFFVSAALLPRTAQAAPVRYTVQAIASGVLGQISFRGANVLLTLTGDTSTVTEQSPGFFANQGTATITITGVGIAAFTSPGFSVFSGFSNGGAASFGEPGFGLLATADSSFTSYDLRTSLGPITGASRFIPEATFATTAGGLRLLFAGDSTFTATVDSPAAPEPGSLALLLPVLGALGGTIRKRRPHGRKA